MRPFRVKRCHQQLFCQLWLIMFLQFMRIVVSAFDYFIHFIESTMWLFHRLQCIVSGLTMTQYYILILYVDLKKIICLLLCVNNVCSAGPTIVFIVFHSVLSSQPINGETFVLSLESILHDLSHTCQHMYSQVKHFQQIRKVQLIKFNPNRQNTYTRTSLFRPVQNRL